MHKNFKPGYPCSAAILILASLVAAAGVPAFAGAKPSLPASHSATHVPATHVPAQPKPSQPKTITKPDTRPAPKTTDQHKPVQQHPDPVKPTPSKDNSRPTPGKPNEQKPSSQKVDNKGNLVSTNKQGRITDVKNPRTGAVVHRGVDGSKRVSLDRPNHSHLVAEHGRRGYVERGYTYRGHEFRSRAYYYHGAYYNRYYRGYDYGGINLNVYAPGYYYSPGFYGWAYNPWSTPIAYGWGWAGSPWFGFYGAFFTPYTNYPSASFWLADYLIANSLQAAYAANQEAQIATEVAATGAAGPILTPDIKRQIADEVKFQLTLENAEAAQTAQNQDIQPASSGISRLLADGHPHVFVAGDGLDLTDNTGQECAISEGDALLLNTKTEDQAPAATLLVLASKGGRECHAGSTVSVNVADLQEMQNHLRETIDQGLKELQEKQGKAGLPPAPPSAQTPPKKTEYADLAPPPSPTDSTDIQAQTQEADKVDTESAPQPPQPAAASQAAPVTVAVGQTPEEVIGALGQPSRKADLPGKLIYFYSGMKITFKAGKVTDVD